MVQRTRLAPIARNAPVAGLQLAALLLAGLLLAAGALQAPPAAAAQSAGGGPVVVELFTSQGCSSCPPADRLLGDLRGRDDVIALSLHVGYWDYIGWSDPFAKARFTERQRSYMRRLDLRYVYTPQMVVDGRLDVVGSRRGAVERQIDRAKRRGDRVMPRLEQRADGAVAVIPAGQSARPATVWLALYDGKHRTRVPRGENAGRELANYNVVRELKRLATWTGARLEIPLDLARARAAGRAGCALIVQQDGTGPILGAAKMPLDAEE
jgi:hypothetical protein